MIPAQAVAAAKTKVMHPKAEWMGARAARKEDVAPPHRDRNTKLKKPTRNWKKENMY